MNKSELTKTEAISASLVGIALGVVLMGLFSWAWGVALAWLGKTFFNIDIAWWKWAFGWFILATGYRTLKHNKDAGR